MKIKSLYILLFFIHHCGFAQEKPAVLLVSFDGFRHDYVERFDAKNFKAFISKGAAAESLTPSFPSKTFPNHYSIITGLYPGNHGLVANTFYDPTRQELYKISNRKLVEDPYYYGGTPLWQLTQKNGFKAASFFWVGSESPIQGSFPDYYYIYDGSVSNEARVDQVVKWFQLPEKDRPRFTSLYFSLVDSQGHTTGPNSEELEQSVLDADKILGYLMQEMKNVKIPVNIIIVSDHGMKEVNTNNSIDFNQIVDRLPPDATVVSDKIISMVFLQKKDLDLTYDLLKGLQNNFRVYKKGKMPRKWHYNKNSRIGDIVLVANPGFAFRTQEVPRKVTGEHGYDPYTTPEMQGILYAQGPNIQVGLKTGPISNIHIYPLVTKILGFKNPSIDGKYRKIKDFYKK